MLSCVSRGPSDCAGPGPGGGQLPSPTPASQSLPFFFFFFNLLFRRAESSLLRGLSSFGEQGLLSRSGVRASVAVASLVAEYRL